MARTPARKPAVSKRTTSARKKATSPAKPRAARAAPQAFPEAAGAIAHGTDPNKRPLLYEALRGVVVEAGVNGGISGWKSCNGKPVSQIRSAAAAHGYKVNTSISSVDGPVFRLNGKISHLCGCGAVDLGTDKTRAIGSTLHKVTACEEAS